MTELVAKYFDGALSQAEEAELGELLESSPEAAEAFAARAVAAYKATGLPEPRWEKRGGFKKMGVWKWPLALLFAASLACAFWPSRPLPRPQLGSDGEAFGIDRSPAPSERSVEEAPEKARDEKLELIAPINALHMAPPEATAPEREASRQGRLLGVVVRQPKEGRVAVQVRDVLGRPVRVLFDDVLKPGEKRFEWDGRLGGGGMAAPGAYDIVVRRDGQEQLQRVVLKPFRQ